VEIESVVEKRRRTTQFGIVAAMAAADAFCAAVWAWTAAAAESATRIVELRMLLDIVRRSIEVYKKKKLRGLM